MDRVNGFEALVGAIELPNRFGEFPADVRSMLSD